MEICKCLLMMVYILSAGSFAYHDNNYDHDVMGLFCSCFLKLFLKTEKTLFLCSLKTAFVLCFSVFYIPYVFKKLLKPSLFLMFSLFLRIINNLKKREPNIPYASIMALIEQGIQIIQYRSKI